MGGNVGYRDRLRHQGWTWRVGRVSAARVAFKEVSEDRAGRSSDNLNHDFVETAFPLIPPLLYTDSLNLNLQPLTERLRSGDARTLARAISIVENRLPGSADLLKALFPQTGHARILGLTGAPGAGKSTLVDQMVAKLRVAGETVGVIVVADELM